MTILDHPAAKRTSARNDDRGGGEQTSTQAKRGFDRNPADGLGAPTSPAPKLLASAMGYPARGNELPQMPREAASAIGNSSVDQLEQPMPGAMPIYVAAALETPASTDVLPAMGVAARGPILDDAFLGIAAEMLDDIEHVRCANENRLRTLTRPHDQPDKDGRERGHGLSINHPGVVRVAALVASMKCDSDLLKELGWQRPPKQRGQDCCLEHASIKNLEKHVRDHPLWPWASAIKGLGAKQFARLLASIGDPYWNDLHDRPRTVRELRAYAGLHVWDHPGDKCADGGKSSSVVGVAPKRQRGQKSNWNEDARKRTWLIATSLLKYDSVYRDVYDQARIKYADTVHPTVCVRCGPAGKPAQPGSPRSAGHQHAMAIRLMMVALLKDLWREARRLHALATSSHIDQHPRQSLGRPSSDRPAWVRPTSCASRGSPTIATLAGGAQDPNQDRRHVKG